ncbi:hypothetical protein GGQ74_000785 [Desulfobaculum xiamenense]|uniref:Uncharacterized protein n=1 Tax=Desulfobaculum xiamenense TaxID=995050 RepID=A0A846QP09_9BACT|nr:DUF6765 family protein [Desulfobaculum xiamenense]NJB67145.1 hypothetical protein [Desulfobaculum xiamenense]
MQIDFHHAVTYAAVREAGFSHEDASRVAYAAQFVDDAANEHLVRFDGGEMYARIASAHKMVDYRNLRDLANHRVWIPFHFLPGNDTGTSFAERLVCRPDSPVAREMVRSCIRDRNAEYGLMRLGVTLHVYADTWAHQGFAGINHEVNDIGDITHSSRHTQDWKAKMSHYFGTLFSRAAGHFVGDTLPLGHGAALCLPDLPYLEWTYVTHDGATVPRNNPSDFLHAADMLCRAARGFRLGGENFEELDGLPEHRKVQILANFRKFEEEDGDRRHRLWLTSLVDDFGYERAPSYATSGPRSWKSLALGRPARANADGIIYHFQPDFLASDWKLFHDALHAHRFHVLHHVLPAFGICAA